MNIEILQATLISGITMGSIYALFGLSLSLIYGVTKVFNFALGSFMMCCCYYVWLFVIVLRINYALSICLGLIWIAAYGFTMELVIMRPLRKTSNWQFYTMVATLALGIFLDNVNLVSFGPLNKALPTIMEGKLLLGELYVRKQDILILGISISVLVFLEIFLKHSKLGMALRAVSQHAKGAQCVGIDTNKMFLSVSVISAILAGMVGILIVQKYYISPLGGWDQLIRAFVIVLMGGMGSSKGVLISGFILGFVESFVTLIFGNFFVLFFWLIILLLILLIRPQGLFGLAQ